VKTKENEGEKEIERQRWRK